jgi:hypothetical protein
MSISRSAAGRLSIHVFESLESAAHLCGVKGIDHEPATTFDK